jgi:hypothetical protein
LYAYRQALRQQVLSNHGTGIILNPAPVEGIGLVTPIVYRISNEGNDCETNDKQNEVSELLDIRLRVHMRLLNNGLIPYRLPLREVDGCLD